jgi:hypothetical protein
MARRSGPDLDVSFVLIAFIFLWVSEMPREPNCFYLRFIFTHLTKTIGQPQSTRFSLGRRTSKVKDDVYGRPSPTCDLVKATSLLLIEPSTFTSSRKLEPVTA